MSKYTHTPLRSSNRNSYKKQTPNKIMFGQVIHSNTKQQRTPKHTPKYNKVKNNNKENFKIDNNSLNEIKSNTHTKNLDFAGIFGNEYDRKSTSNNKNRNCSTPVKIYQRRDSIFGKPLRVKTPTSQTPKHKQSSFRNSTIQRTITPQRRLSLIDSKTQTPIDRIRQSRLSLNLSNTSNEISNNTPLQSHSCKSSLNPSSINISPFSSNNDNDNDNDNNSSIPLMVSSKSKIKSQKMNSSPFNSSLNISPDKNNTIPQSVIFELQLIQEEENDLIEKLLLIQQKRNNILKKYK